jgi:hypothetical protein
MIKFSTKHIPSFLKSFRGIDPIVLFKSDEKIDSNRYITLYNHVTELLCLKGVSKKTYSNRLHLSTEYLIEFYSKNDGNNINFLEVGASNGSTSFYTHLGLKNRGIKINTISTDRVTSVFFSQLGLFRFYYTNDDPPFLCIIMGLFYVDLIVKHNDYISKLLVTKIMNLINNKRPFQKKSEICLKYPRIILDDSFRYETLDVFEINGEFIEKFDIIRCSNLLQLCYFSRLEIITAIDILKSYLKETGLLIITRDVSEEMKESGVVFQKSNNDLAIVHKFAKDSEIEQVVLAKY